MAGSKFKDMSKAQGKVKRVKTGSVDQGLAKVIKQLDFFFF